MILYIAIIFKLIGVRVYKVSQIITKMIKNRFYRSLLGASETKNGKLIKNISSKRWNQAHVSEEEFWKDFTTEILADKYSQKNEYRAEVFLEEWSKYIKISKNTKILQIGCGPEDVINHFKIGKRYSIDPLADFYKKKFKFDYKSSHLIKAAGERIPFKDNHFDIVILTNVLDHTHIPTKVLSEIRRVLKKGGMFHFENYIFQRNFLRIAKFFGVIKKIFKKEIYNIHHPYMFTMQDLKDLISQEFVILSEEVGRDPGNYENIEGLKDIIKKEGKLAIKLFLKFGLYGGINYACICKRK